MKNLTFIFAFAILLSMSSCDVQSGITQKSLEKYQPTPSPERTVAAEEPIDPADVIKADTALPGPQIFISRSSDKKKINCDKYNRVMVNGNGHVVEINGACSRIMVNGNGNKITAVASVEIITNGANNIVAYAKFVNGNRPQITDNSGQNLISKETPAQ